jgi:hypothetical protein
MLVRWKDEATPIIVMTASAYLESPELRLVCQTSNPSPIQFGSMRLLTFGKLHPEPLTSLAIGWMVRPKHHLIAPYTKCG